MTCYITVFPFLGCQVCIEWDPIRYSSMETNATLADLYQANAESLGVKYDPLAKAEGRGSTDMGNVSHVVPSTHVLYAIDTEAGNHSHAFTAAAGTEAAHKKTLIASKAMAMTAIDVICNPELIKKVKEDFKNHTLLVNDLRFVIPKRSCLDQFPKKNLFKKWSTIAEIV